MHCHHPLRPSVGDGPSAVCARALPGSHCEDGRAGAGSGDTGEDQITINSVKVYGARYEYYNFRQIDGKLESTNQGKSNTVCNSYIPIDLTDVKEKVKITVNAEISSEESNDYGYIVISDNEAGIATGSASGTSSSTSTNSVGFVM